MRHTSKLSLLPVFASDLCLGIETSIKDDVSKIRLLTEMACCLITNSSRHGAMMHPNVMQKLLEDPWVSSVVNDSSLKPFRANISVALLRTMACTLPTAIMRVYLEYRRRSPNAVSEADLKCVHGLHNILTHSTVRLSRWESLHENTAIQNIVGGSKRADFTPYLTQLEYAVHNSLLAIKTFHK